MVIAIAIVAAVVIGFLIILLVDTECGVPIGIGIIAIFVLGVVGGTAECRHVQRQNAIKAGVAKWEVTIDQQSGKVTKEFKYLTNSNKPNELKTEKEKQ